MSETVKEKTNPRRCCVPNCKSRSDRITEDGKKLSFHEIPSNTKLAEIYLKFINRKDWKPCQKSLLCSRHFDPSCFIDCINGRRKLARGSIPTLMPDASGHWKPVPTYIKVLNGCGLSEFDLGCDDEDWRVCSLPMMNMDAEGKFMYDDEESREDDPLQIFSGSEDEEDQLEEEPAISLNDMCRICMEVTSDTVLIYGEEGRKQQLPEKLNFGLPIKVSEKDVLPLNMCRQCIPRLNQNFEFAMLCKKSDVALMEMYYLQQCLFEVSNVKADVLKKTQSELETFVTTGENASVREEQQKITIEDKHSLIVSDKETALDKMSRINMKKLAANSIVSKEDNTRIDYLCKYCFGKFYDVNKCVSHIIISHKSKLVEENRLQKQLKAKKTEENIKMIKPEKIPKKKVDEIEMKRKIKQTDGPGQCNTCGKIYKNRYCLKNHMKRHTDVRNYMCEQCGRSYVTSGDLTEHRKTHRASIKVECNFCKRIFKYKKILRDHIILHHLEKYSYVCEICKDSFNSISKIIEHLKIHDSITASFQKIYLHVCPFCDKKCNSKYQKILHIKKLHPGVNKKHNVDTQNSFAHYCNTCNKYFKSGMNYRRHIDMKHTGLIKPRQFRSEPTIRKNKEKKMKIKKEIKSINYTYRYECDICPSKFKYESNFKKHMDSKHFLTVQIDKVVENVDKKVDDIEEEFQPQVFFLPADHILLISCEYCEEVFETLELKETHIIESHLNEIEVYKSFFDCTNQIEISLVAE